MAEPTDAIRASLAGFQEECAKLRSENSILRADLGFWKKQHERAVERENLLKKELQDKNARIAYFTRQLYERKAEQKKAEPETRETIPATEHRSRGHQKGSPAPQRRNHEHLPTEEEIYDLGEEEKFCAICGLPMIEMADTEDSVLIETQDVSGYRRHIQRKKYLSGCRCPGTKGITTAPGPAKLIPHSCYGASVWIHILIRKYLLQIPVARVLQNLSLHGVDIPAGSVGDNLKRLSPLFEPIYAALEQRSQAAEWWQADETRWHVFETTKTKTNSNWYLWVFISGESVVYIIDPTRAAKVIEDHLGSVVEGILLVDRYSAYKSYAAKHEKVLLAFCWAHARRDFREAGLQYKQLAEWAERWEESINGLFHQTPSGSSTPSNHPRSRKRMRIYGKLWRR